MIAVGHPTVNAFVRALVEALEKAGRLGCFHTTLARGRRSVAVGRGRVREYPWREIARLAALRMGWRGPVAHERGWASVDAVYRDLDRRMAASLRGREEGVYCYEDGALETFRAAEGLGVRRFYELPILYWEEAGRLLAAEAERWPRWEPTLVGTRDSAEKLARKTEEMRLAETVICPSASVARSVPPGKRVAVAEFGSPPSAAGGSGAGRRGAGGKLRLLFAGSMTQRKGLADLFAAMQLVGGGVELVVMGAPLMPMAFYREEYPGFLHEPPRPHGEVLRLMETCDALVLPSVVEGRALVQQEGMSRGLPLVVTPNAGGEDLVVEGETGFLVPPGSPEALAERIGWLAGHRGELEGMRAAAAAMAARRTWGCYAEKIMGVLG